MTEFKYVARTSEGKLTEGVVSANDRASAIMQIEHSRFIPIKIEAVAQGRAAARKGSETKSPAPTQSGAAPVEALSHNHLFLFTEQLAHLLASGMTLDEALAILERRLKHPRLQGLSQSLHRALVDGRSLSQALRDYPKIFSPLYVNMIAAGEASGALPQILRRLVIHLGDLKAMRDRVQQALIYPAVLVVAGTLLILVFMTVMVPRLTGFFAETGQGLPTATKILVSANHVIVAYWWVAVLAAIGGTSLVKFLKRTQPGRMAFDRFLLRMPGYGGVTRYRFYAQFARTLSTLMENGVTLLRALELLEEISGNEFIRQNMVEARRAVTDGAALSNALRVHGIFPELFLDMMSVGEQTGKFAETMQNIADMYERELDRQVKLITALIPPVIITVIAALVGLLVYGILSAVFNLTQGLQHRIH